MLNESQISELVKYEGKMFSDNYSNTGSSLCLNIDVDDNKVYYQECYCQYGNFTGKNIYGEKRNDKLYQPRTGLKTTSLTDFYGKAIGWV